MEDQEIDERLILKWIFGKWNGEQGLDFGRSGVGAGWYLVNAVMKIVVPQREGISCLAEKMLPFLERPCSMQEINK